MRVKTCTRCRESKPLNQFPPVRRGEPKLQSWCRACFAENNARYYREHRDTQKARLLRNGAARRECNRRRIVEYLTAHACVDCGEADIVVLQFDHVRDKSLNISTLLRDGASWTRIEQEIAKCEVRCANCHRLRTALGWSFLNDVAGAIDPDAAALAHRPQQLLLATAMEPRICRVCRKTKTLAGFPFRSVERQTRQWICLECQRSYTKGWYERNRERQIATAAKNNVRRRRETRARVRAFRVVCVDCGETNPLLLDFDHLRDKQAGISELVHSGMPWAVIEAEIDKCEVRCANCHARKTARELGNYRTKVV